MGAYKGDNANKLIIDSYKSALGEGLPWLVGVEGHLVVGGVGGMPPGPDEKPFIYNFFYVMSCLGNLGWMLSLPSGIRDIS